MRTTLGSRPLWRIIAAFCLCCGLWGSASARAQEAADKPATSGEVKALKEQVEKLTKAQEEAKNKAPEFRFQWFSYGGARLETTAAVAQTYQAEIWPGSGGGPSKHLGTLTTEEAVRTARDTLKEGCPDRGDGDDVPLWIGRLDATPEGSSTSLRLICERALDPVMRQNGWVTIYYTDGTTGDVKTQVASSEIVFRQAPVNAIERSTLAVDLGTVFSLQNDGTWKTKPEIAIAAASRWTMRLSGFVDLRYSYTAAKAKEPEPAPKEADPDPAPAADDDNPFTSEGGTFRGNIYAAYLPFRTPSFGLIGGAGFSTVPNAPTVEAPLRLFAGARLEVFAYNTQRSKDFFGNASGFFQFGYARDRSWEFDEAVTDASGATSKVHHDEQNRIWLEGQIKFSDTKDSALVYSARVFGDFPTNNKGTSDLRFSVLATVMVQRLLGFTTPPKG